MAAAAAGGNDLAANRVALFYGNGKDVITPKGWIAKLDRLQTANGWTDQATLSNGANALREVCEEWYSIEIQEEPDMTYATFKTRFLRFTGATNRSYMGFTQWPKMTAPRGNDPLNVFYNRIMTSSYEWKETVPQVPVPADMAQVIPAAILARPNIAKLNAEDHALLFANHTLIGAHTVTRHQTMGLFYNGLGIATREFLRDKTFPSCREMRDAVDEFETSRKDNGQPVNSLQDEGVDALRRQNGRRTTGPPQAKGKPVECHYCKKMGHIQKDCRKRARDKAPMVPKPPGKVNSLENPDAVSQFQDDRNHLNL